MGSKAFQARMRRELEILDREPPPGISASPVDDRLNKFEATILGVDGTPYQNGTFKLDIDVPERYPFEPPKVRFVTPIYHPNIDTGGRICLDILNMPPKGSWRPSLNLSTVLASIQLLMGEPNGDDGLMADITSEFVNNRREFSQKAERHTKQHAQQVTTQPSEQKTKQGTPQEPQPQDPPPKRHRSDQ